MELMDEQEMIRKAYFDATQASGLPPQWIYEFALNLLAAHNVGAQEPVAHILPRDLEALHTYSKQCQVVLYREPRKTRVPIYTQPQPITDAARDVHALRVARAEIGRTISDPMWADHAEVSKRALKRWHEAIDVEIERLDRATGE